jgi:RNA 2',3'-cyclic 3'-phosphodiesterase
MARHDLRRVRTFIAVELSPGVKHRAGELIKELKPTGADVNWTPPQQMHLTLKFLGEISRDDIIPLCRLTGEVAAKFQPFDLGFRGTGAFPHTDHPRTLWIGIEEGLEEIRALQKELEQALYDKLGFPKERRQFTPHLTIGRVHKATPEMNDIMEAHSKFVGDFSEVDELVVFASYKERDGQRHEPMGHATLGQTSKRRSPRDEEDDEEDGDEEEEV